MSIKLLTSNCTSDIEPGKNERTIFTMKNGSQHIRNVPIITPSVSLCIHNNEMQYALQLICNKLDK